jgi:D-aminoacyl-tRNA deacylase
MRSLAAAIYEGCIGIAPLGGQLGDLPLPRKKLEEGFCFANPRQGFRSSAMKVVIQRVAKASVTVEERLVSEIGPGLLILLGVQDSDTEKELDWLVGKVSRLRIFPDEAGAMNRSVEDVGGGILVVSQFTLLAETRKGNRPSFIRAAAPGVAQQTYERFCMRLEQEIGRPVGRGVFGARMQVSLVNDGPVTICIDTSGLSLK